MPRSRVPGYITRTPSHDFGEGVPVRSQNGPMPSSGDVGNGLDPTPPQTYRKPIPPGSIGTQETTDLERLPPPQYIRTVAMYDNETRDPQMHCASDAQMKSADRPVEFNSFASFTPRTAPMPRTAGDQGYLEPYKGLQADPVMISENDGMQLYERNARQKELYGSNRDGVVDDKE